MATLDDLLALGDLPLLDKNTHRLPADTEATLPAAIGKGVANGVAATNGQGIPVTTQGVPVAVIGTTSGTAADAAVVATQIGAAQSASATAVSQASAATAAAASATTAANNATTAATNAATAAASKVGTGTGASAVPQLRYYATKPTVAELVAAGVPAGSVITVAAAT